MTSGVAVPALVGLSELRDAERVLAPVAVHTPLLPVVLPPGMDGGPVFIKPEMLQRGGAFKFRGAYYFLSRLSDEQRKRGVIAPSSGNHAQAVALAARMFGCPATVVMPTTVTAAKKGGAERLGARVVLAGTTTHDRMTRAMEIAAEEGCTIVPPYDDPFIIAGQGSAGMEIAQDMPDVNCVLVPVGGGGLSAGVATAIKLMAPRARVIGVEPEGAAKLSLARSRGEPTLLSSTSSIADGLLAVEIGHLNFVHHQQYLDDVVTVPDDALPRAMRFLLDRMKLVAEPSGAITLAAILEGIVKPDPAGSTVAVLSGGNIEWSGLQDILGDG